jgi:hypothetical protein
MDESQRRKLAEGAKARREGQFGAQASPIELRGANASASTRVVPTGNVGRGGVQAAEPKKD